MYVINAYLINEVGSSIYNGGIGSECTILECLTDTWVLDRHSKVYLDYACEVVTYRVDGQHVSISILLHR